MSEQCPCGSKKDYGQCCEPLLKGEKAKTAEQLMRSRYVAYTQANIDYVESTHDKATRKDLDLAVAKKWATDSDWIGLEVVHTEAGGEDDEQGIVEFKAHYRLNGDRQQHHEVSEFVKKDGEWFYHDGKLPDLQQVKRDTPKVGRNDPCPCGSGKKFKKCCGAAS